MASPAAHCHCLARRKRVSDESVGRGCWTRVVSTSSTQSQLADSSRFTLLLLYYAPSTRAAQLLSALTPPALRRKYLKKCIEAAQ